MYQIHWKSINTGATGHGTGEFTKKEAQQIANDLNIQNKGITIHWVESTEPDAPMHEQETKDAPPADNG